MNMKRRGPTDFLEDVDLDAIRLRAALEGRPVALLDGAKKSRSVRATTPVVLPHGRIVKAGEARAVGLADFIVMVV